MTHSIRILFSKNKQTEVKSAEEDHISYEGRRRKVYILLKFVTSDMVVLRHITKGDMTSLCKEKEETRLFF